MTGQDARLFGNAEIRELVRGVVRNEVADQMVKFGLSADRAIEMQELISWVRQQKADSTVSHNESLTSKIKIAVGVVVGALTAIVGMLTLYVGHLLTPPAPPPPVAPVQQHGAIDGSESLADLWTRGEDGSWRFGTLARDLG